MRDDRTAPRVLLDVDGVIADFVGAALSYLQERHGISIPREQIQTMDMFESLPVEVSKLLEKEFDRPGYALSIPAYPGAIQGISLLDEIADVYYVTAPYHSATWAHDRIEWLAKQLGKSSKVMKNYVVSTKTKFLVAGDYLVDDHPLNVRDWQHHHQLGFGFVWHAPYNRELELQLPRVDSWEELVRHVKFWEHPLALQRALDGVSTKK